MIKLSTALFVFAVIFSLGINSFAQQERTSLACWDPKDKCLRTKIVFKSAKTESLPVCANGQIKGGCCRITGAPAAPSENTNRTDVSR